MKRSPEEHAARFDEKAEQYDDDRGPVYRTCAGLVVAHARGAEPRAPAGGPATDPLGPDDVVVDLGTGTGAIALALAPDAGAVVGRDVSDGMLARAREKAAERGLESVEFGRGSFREPALDGSPAADGADVVVSNFAMHHLADDEKREAVQVVAALSPRRFVLGDVAFFGHPDPGEPFYSPEVDDPATVGHLAEAFADAGFALTAVERVRDQVCVLVGERW